ncbi:MAG: membrane protein insertion efficiency factor YidD [Candidatus Omnitrophica bacterium]|nr:membrane protein insertion efficiency factor YidD [Candidatus Omnitrophota bacterium]
MNIAIFLLRAIHNIFSIIMLPSCRFFPSCSSYAEQAISRLGIVRGSAMTIRRLIRCHPLCKGGFDPVPE